MSVSIIGWSHSKFARRLSEDVEALMADAAVAAIDHAGISAGDVDCAYVGHFNAGLDPQDFTAPLLLQSLPALRFKPITRVENACATGSAALFQAAQAIESGAASIALVVGVEKMSGVAGPEVGQALLRASYVKEEGGCSSGFAGVFEQVVQRYRNAYSDPSAGMASIAAKNCHNGLDNPYAQFHNDPGFDFCNTVSDSNPLIAGCLRRSDCSAISDGAAALILADESTARVMRRAVAIRSRSHATDYLPLSRRDLSKFEGCAHVWRDALGVAGLTLEDLDLVETHDCFSIAELMQYEAMGLARPGEGARVAMEGVTARNGALPVNPSGGLKSRGHPIGATGVSMHVMVAMQLCEEAGGMQVPGASLAGVFNMGGVAVANYCSILERTR